MHFHPIDIWNLTGTSTYSHSSRPQQETDKYRPKLSEFCQNCRGFVPIKRYRRGMGGMEMLWGAVVFLCSLLQLSQPILNHENSNCESFKNQILLHYSFQPTPQCLSLWLCMRCSHYITPRHVRRHNNHYVVQYSTIESFTVKLIWYSLLLLLI